MNPRGFAFVRFVDIRDAEDAIKEMHHSTLDGEEIEAAMATNNKRPERRCDEF